MPPEPSHMMLRASALINILPEMIFVGIYETEYWKPLALADREKVQIYPDADENRCQGFAFNITPREVQAIANHIRTRDNALTQINIANLQFVCLRTESSCMTGMSNFNMDYETHCVKDVDKTLFELSNTHYASDDLLEGTHALHISAILKEEFMIVGLCRAGNVSSLKLIKEIVEQPKEQPVEKISLVSSGTRRSQFMAKSKSLRQSLKTYSSFVDNEAHEHETNDDNDALGLDFEVGFKEDNENDSIADIINNIGNSEDGTRMDTIDVGLTQNLDNINRRPSTKTPEDRRLEQSKRETEFCEDWRSATIRSIEALKNIGPFIEDHIPVDDECPLIDNIATPCQGGEEMTTRGETAAMKMSTERRRSSTAKKQPSRATFV